MTANQIISSVAHEIGSIGHAHLAMAIHITMGHMPHETSLRQFVYPEIAKCVNKSPAAVEKSIERAVKSCWDYGNREIITNVIGKDSRQAPSVKKFIFYFAYYLAYDIPYHKIKDAKDGKDYPLII